MNYRSKIFILSGLFGLIAIFLTKKLFFAYYFGDNGVDLLPISLFEMLVFGIGVLTYILILVMIAILVKRSNHPVTFKKRFHLLIPSFMGWVILFLLIKEDMSGLVVPSAIIIYGLILLNLNRFVTSRLVYFGLVVLITGFISFLLPSFNWLFMYMAFAILPILFGLVLLRKPVAPN
jgi:hypothetical protein